ncbi:hypothetical protein Hesp01_19930 [Herbidospora sp. NBRC 101105]|nr:hypothetical protein Hesp01_19930 [Herbidospora sp. NBRC 101105]
MIRIRPDGDAAGFTRARPDPRAPKARPTWAYIASIPDDPMLSASPWSAPERHGRFKGKDEE